MRCCAREWIVTIALTAAAIASAESVKIGVLANRGTEHCLEQWTPTAEYLTQQIEGATFEIVPLDFEQILVATQQGDVDFLLGNSAIYIELSIRFKAARIATLNNLGADGNGHSVFGGVIFARNQIGAPAAWKDLSGKHIGAVDASSFGGWLMARRELQRSGLRPGKEFKVSFLGTHDAVVHAVLNGEVDAGTVRTDTLERMELEGKIDLNEIRTL
jgi:ABC-type phosphate/phosphonate transport system substrate-binding protein